MTKNSDIVRAFVDAFNDMDLDRIMEFFDDEAVYHNIPMEPVSGVDAIRGVLQGFVSMASEMDWLLHRIAEDFDGNVLTERTDRFFIGEQWVEIPVMGIFEIRDRKIFAWRDYFDLGQFQRQLPG
jgi:limonene-1,2-epoxide hydrolase